MAVHPLHPEKERMLRRHSGNSHQRTSHRRVELFSQRNQLCRSIARNHAAAEIDIRPLRLFQHLCSLPQPLLGSRSDGLRFCRMILRRKFAERFLHILRDIHKHRPRSAGFCDLKCRADRFREFVNMLYDKIMLCHRHTHADDIDLLKAVSADLAARDIARNCDHRHRIQISRRDARNEICCARPGGRHDNADFARCSCIAVRGMGSALFMRRQHMPDAVSAAVELIEQINDLSARIAEQHITALLDQRFNHDFCACHLHNCSSFLSFSAAKRDI